MGDSNVGAIADEAWASTGKDVGGAGAQDRAQVDGPTAKERGARSLAERVLAAQQTQARWDAFTRRKKPKREGGLT